MVTDLTSQAGPHTFLWAGCSHIMILNCQHTNNKHILHVKHHCWPTSANSFICGIQSLSLQWKLSILIFFTVTPGQRNAGEFEIQDTCNHNMQVGKVGLLATQGSQICSNLVSQDQLFCVKIHTFLHYRSYHKIKQGLWSVFTFLVKPWHEPGSCHIHRKLTVCWPARCALTACLVASTPTWTHLPSRRNKKP